MYLFIYVSPHFFQWQFKTKIRVIFVKKQGYLLFAKYSGKCFTVHIHFSFTLGGRHYYYYPHFTFENVEAKKGLSACL